MTPLELYQNHLNQQGYSADPQQQHAILALQRVYAELNAPAPHWPHRLLQKIKGQKSIAVKGVYLWGGVGIGKTWLLDIFFETLTAPTKMRMHFHRFMQEVHAALKDLQGHADPLKKVAQRWAQRARVICLDEFLVNDIVDAMILANLLQALFAEGITLITTSNTPPAELYRDGIQREYFIAAIASLEQHLEIIHLTTTYDYRLRELAQAGTYYFPLDAQADIFLTQHFKRLTGLTPAAAKQDPLQIEGRAIEVRAWHEGVVWFDFKVLCHTPRSQLDYLAIARRFHTVLLSNVPEITAQQNNLARYLINLVDVFYDARVKLIISAAVPIEQLYVSGRAAFEFRRTQSRLLEMQSQEYLNQPSIGG